MKRFVYDETDSLFVILLVVFFLPSHLSIHLLSFLALSMCHSSLEAPSSCITDSIHIPSVLRSSMHFSFFFSCVFRLQVGSTSAVLPSNGAISEIVQV